MLLQRSLSLHQRFRKKIRRHRVSLEAELASLSPVAGLRLDEVPWPQGTLVVNLVRSGTEIAPSAALVLCEGDRLQILIDENLKPELEKLLAGGK
jgi:NhaP-type Na+/H+ and K+/H+ antiporter